jgi:hypothetical protein
MLTESEYSLGHDGTARVPIQVTAAYRLRGTPGVLTRGYPCNGLAPSAARTASFYTGALSAYAKALHLEETALNVRTSEL